MACFRAQASKVFLSFLNYVQSKCEKDSEQNKTSKLTECSIKKVCLGGLGVWGRNMKPDDGWNKIENKRSLQGKRK